MDRRKVPSGAEGMVSRICDGIALAVHACYLGRVDPEFEVVILGGHTMQLQSEMSKNIISYF